MLQPSAPPPPPTHLLGVLRSLWRWRRPVLITTAVAAVLAVIVSLLLPIYYTGYTSFVAISPEQISIESTFGTGGGQVQFYGTGDDIDRLLSIAESNQLVDHMVDRFGLYGAYGVDTTDVKAAVRVREEFLDNYEVSRSPRDVVELSISDRDPARAAAMATAAREHLNTITLALIRATHAKNADGLRAEIAASETTLSGLNETLSDLRQTSGIYDTEAQRESLATASSQLDQRMVTTTSRLATFRQQDRQDSIRKLTVDLSGMESLRASLDGQLAKLNANVGPIENLEEEREQTNDDLTENRTRLKQYEAILSGERRTLEVIEEASLPLVKSYPVRWLIVVGTTLAAFLLAVFGALLIDHGRRYDWRSITR